MSSGSGRTPGLAGDRPLGVTKPCAWCVGEVPRSAAVVADADSVLEGCWNSRQRHTRVECNARMRRLCCSSIMEEARAAGACTMVGSVLGAGVGSGNPLNMPALSSCPAEIVSAQGSKHPTVWLCPSACK